MFFACEASNFWGIGPTSNIAFTPPPPLPLTNVTIGITQTNAAGIPFPGK